MIAHSGQGRTFYVCEEDGFRSSPWSDAGRGIATVDDREHTQGSGIRRTGVTLVGSCPFGVEAW